MFFIIIFIIGLLFYLLSAYLPLTLVRNSLVVESANKLQVVITYDSEFYIG